MSTTVAIASAGVKQGIAAEKRRRVAVRQQAYMAHGVARGVERFELYRSAHAYEITGSKPAIDAGNAGAGIFMG